MTKKPPPKPFTPNAPGRDHGVSKNQAGITLTYDQGGKTLGQIWAEQNGDDAGGPVNPQFSAEPCEPQPHA